MGKLNIAHHKSYHPYRKDNIERVRRDEEEARLKEETEEGRMRLADSEARINLLRARSGVSASNSKNKQEEQGEHELLEQVVDSSLRRAINGSSGLSLTSSGHVNLFEDIEQNSVTAVLARSTELNNFANKKGKSELEKGIPLAPSAKDLKPWYSEKNLGSGRGDEDQRSRDLSHKSHSDPLRAIQHELATRYPTSNNSRTQISSQSRIRAPGPKAERSGTEAHSDLTRLERQSRESTERARALALKAKRKLAGSATPSSVRGSDELFQYGDQFNARAVAEAHRYRDVRDRPR